MARHDEAIAGEARIVEAAPEHVEAVRRHVCDAPSFPAG